jgi:hypothetical protein
MSLKKYLESRKFKLSITSDLSLYKENLLGVLSSLIFISEVNNKQILKKTIPLHHIEKQLEEIDFPFIEKVMFALNAVDSKKIKDVMETFDAWSMNRKDNVINSLKYCFIEYQNKIISQKFSADEIDAVYSNFIFEAEKTLQMLKDKIRHIAEKHEILNNYPIHIEGIFDENELSLMKFKIKVGDFLENYFVLKISDNFKINKKELVIDQMSEQVKKDIFKLISELNEDNNQKNIDTYYFNVDKNKSYFFKFMQKDLSWGIKPEFPKHIQLTNIPYLQDEQDTWKIKIAKKYVQKELHEGDIEYFSLIGRPLVYWMERYVK